MSLADELLADFDEVAQEPDDVLITVDVIKNNGDIDHNEQHKIKSVFSVAKLLTSDKTKSILEKINFYNSNKRSESFATPNYNPEYEVVVDANALLAEIDTEILIVYKFVKDLYNKRFPELESLVTSAYEYIHTVHFLGNITDSVKMDGIDFLPPAIKMVVTVSASTTLGEKLTDEEMVCLNEACQLGFDLADAKLKIIDYVQSRMSFIAPNFCRIVGPNSAAEIMGAAGGLSALQKMPACNIMLLGAQKRNLAGFSSVSLLPHTGFIYFSPIVQRVHPHLRKKASRVVSAKIALAVRVDSAHEFSGGSYGDLMLCEIHKRYEKWMAPPPVKMVKALPVPDDAPRKRRGGRRQRHVKQRYALTELRKQANRVHFGLIQEDVCQEEVGFGLNALAQSGSGKIRVAQIDSKTKISISKRLQKNLASMNSNFGTRTSSLRTNVSGLASSVAFTPMQGIEIINPNISEKDGQPSNDKLKYFSNQSGFMSSKNI